MPSRNAWVVLLLLVAPAAHAASLPESIGVPIEPDIPWVQHPVSAGSPMTYLEVGDMAPAFSYLDVDDAWHSFDRLLEQGPVVLLFGASDEDVLGIERMSRAFAELGVTPVFAMDRRSGSASKVARRLEVSGPVVSDPRCAIATLYNSLDPLTHRHAPAFFVVDGKRRIRSVEHGPIPQTLQLIAAVARGLGRPLPESAHIMSSRAPDRAP